MSKIDGIQFDKTLFSQFNSSVVILYQPDNEDHLSNPLSYVNLLTFVKTFNNISDFQSFLNTNPRKTITLFSYSDIIQTWFYNKNPIPDNVQQIIIICPSTEEIDYFKRWTRRYTKKVTKVITYNQFQRELLVFGTNYIEMLYFTLDDDDETQQSLKQHRQNLCSALIDIFQQESNKL